MRLKHTTGIRYALTFWSPKGNPQQNKRERNENQSEWWDVGGISSFFDHKLLREYNNFCSSVWLKI